MKSPLRIALVGLGKIAHDQHLPAIAQSERFELVAAASPGAQLPGIAVFEDIESLLSADIALEAVAMCQPPQLRHEAAVRAIRAGKHVLLEKPPGTKVSEVETLAALAGRGGVTLFGAWHSCYAPGVPGAREWLSHRHVQAVEICWKEDVRHWHAGQQWIWDPGGMGVFDAGINALSIAASLLPHPLQVLSGTLDFPANRRTPIAAELFLLSGEIPLHATFDWRWPGDPIWDIQVNTDADTLFLGRGGARLRIGAQRCPPLPEQEYPKLYQRFAELIDTRQSEVDVAPLRLVADAFVRCASRTVEPFND